MSLCIDDNATARLITELADLQGFSAQEAVKRAVMAELERLQAARPLRVRFAELRNQHPLPPATGLPADKAFFDTLSDDL